MRLFFLVKVLFILFPDTIEHMTRSTKRGRVREAERRAQNQTNRKMFSLGSAKQIGEGSFLDKSYVQVFIENIKNNPHISING